MMPIFDQRDICLSTLVSCDYEDYESSFYLQYFFFFFFSFLFHELGKGANRTGMISFGTKGDYVEVFDTRRRKNYEDWHSTLQTLT